MHLTRIGISLAISLDGTSEGGPVQVAVRLRNGAALRLRNNTFLLLRTNG